MRINNGGRVYLEGNHTYYVYLRGIAYIENRKQASVVVKVVGTEVEDFVEFQWSRFLLTVLIGFKKVVVCREF